MYSSVSSIPIKFLHNILQATQVVPLQAKGSNTISQGLEISLISQDIRWTGLTVGWLFFIVGAFSQLASILFSTEHSLPIPPLFN